MRMPQEADHTFLLHDLAHLQTELQQIPYKMGLHEIDFMQALKIQGNLTH